MGDQLVNNSTVALVHTLKTQGQQSEILADLLIEVSGIKDQMETTAKEVETHVEESRAILEKVTEQVTINYDEQKDMISIVSSKSNMLAKEHLSKVEKEYSDNLFKSWKGLFNRRIHSKLKQRMNVVRYTSIKRADYDEAMEYLKTLSYVSFSKKDLEPTPAILKVLELEG
ncbi:ORF6C domain-containing protein [Enterococcus rotai]|uniref:ORF6C domain-containing protein n=1 Tax=Enterococcus rotai TaxID=118060 RepID=UPI0032B5CF4A